MINVMNFYYRNGWFVNDMAFCRAVSYVPIRWGTRMKPLWKAVPLKHQSLIVNTDTRRPIFTSSAHPSTCCIQIFLCRWWWWWSISPILRSASCTPWSADLGAWLIDFTYQCIRPSGGEFPRRRLCILAIRNISHYCNKLYDNLRIH